MTSPVGSHTLERGQYLQQVEKNETGSFSHTTPKKPHTHNEILVSLKNILSCYNLVDMNLENMLSGNNNSETKTNTTSLYLWNLKMLNSEVQNNNQKIYI